MSYSFPKDTNLCRRGQESFANLFVEPSLALLDIPNICVILTEKSFKKVTKLSPSVVLF
jgi:hypothetical protein